MAFDLNSILSPFGVAYRFWAAEPVQRTSAIVGTAILASWSSNAVSFLCAFLWPSAVLKYRHAEKGSWVLVTGASDGIGYGFADVFLARGFNVLLHGRNAQKLERVKAELASKHPQGAIEIVVADAGNNDDAYMTVVDRARRLPGKLTVLVNNVGGVSTRPQYAGNWEIEHAAIDFQININLRFVTHLTRELLPVLKANGPGLIMNCGSLAGVMNLPYIGTYSATKAYVHAFTHSLQVELTTEGGDWNRIEVMGFLIGNVRSQGNKTEMPGFTIDSRECAEGCLARVGNGRTMNYPHWRTAAQIIMLSLIPNFMLQRIMRQEMGERRRVEQKSL